MATAKIIPKTIPLIPDIKVTPPIKFRIVEDIYASTSDRILVVGRTGSGKSHGSKKWLLPHYPRLLFYDNKRENADFEHDIIIGTAEELEKKINLYDVILYQPEPSEEEKDLTEDFNQICRIVFQNKNRAIYVDEAMAVTSPSKIPYWYKIILTQGRSYNVGAISATQRPKNIHNTLISEAEHFFIFSLNLQGDIDKLEEMIGVDAASEIRNLPEYHFIYYSVKEHKAFLMPPIGSQREEKLETVKKKECSLKIPIINYCIIR